MVPSRRQIGAGALRSLALFSLVDLLRGRDVVAAPARAPMSEWLREIDRLGRECRNGKLAQKDWQRAVEALLARIDLSELIRHVDLEALAKELAGFGSRGAKSLAVAVPPGVPANLVFGRQVFAMKKGRAIVPHGHDNMVTAFVVLAGKLRGRHYDRLETQPEHLVLQPTIDRDFGPGDTSSISDVKDNVHWFRALSDSAFVFNIHVLNVTDEKTASSGRVYVDPMGEKLSGGRIRARLIDHEECTRRYG